MKLISFFLFSYRFFFAVSVVAATDRLESISQTSSNWSNKMKLKCQSKNIFSFLIWWRKIQILRRGSVEKTNTRLRTHTHTFIYIWQRRQRQKKERRISVIDLNYVERYSKCGKEKKKRYYINETSQMPANYYNFLCTLCINLLTSVLYSTHDALNERKRHTWNGMKNKTLQEWERTSEIE